MSTGLRFDIEKLVRELALIKEIAAPLLSPAGAQSLEQARWALHQLPRDNPRAVWRVTEPVTTIYSCGEYRPAGTGGHTMRALMTTTWDLTRHNQATVEVRDNVSTLVQLHASDQQVASFRMDIAAVNGAPGCGLHTQITNHDSWFPDDLDVPRFPTFIPTLGGVIEFVLGELFQSRWTKLVSGHTLAASWRELQTELWMSFLSWQKEVIVNSTVSPWLDLKARGCQQLVPHA